MSSQNKNPRIFIDKNGNWFHDGIRITHRWTYLANNKNLDIDEDGCFFVDDGHGRVYVNVEDTPFVIKMIYKKEGKYFAVLNDETVEPLIYGEISIRNGNIPYTLVKNQKFKARFTSQAYYELTKYIIQKSDGYYIDTEDGEFKISGMDESI